MSAKLCSNLPASVGSRLWWVEQDGARVRINGVEYLVSVGIGQAFYPYVHEYFHLYATMTDKTRPEYLDKKRQLGDDWSTDLLASDTFRGEIMLALLSLN